MRQTSIAAYHAIKDNGLLSKRKLEVYSIIYNHGPLTSEDLLQLVGGSYRHSGTYTGRFSELEAMGVICEVGKVKSKRTNNIITLWDVTDKLPKPIPKKPTKKEKKEKIYRYIDDEVSLLQTAIACDRLKKMIEDL